MTHWTGSSYWPPLSPTVKVTSSCILLHVVEYILTSHMPYMVNEQSFNSLKMLCFVTVVEFMTYCIMPYPHITLHCGII